MGIQYGWFNGKLERYYIKKDNMKCRMSNRDCKYIYF